MDGQRFDHLTVHLTGVLTRRRFGRLLLGLGLGGAATLAEATVVPRPARAFRCANGGTQCCYEGGPICDGECCGSICYYPSQAYCAGDAICPNGWDYCPPAEPGWGGSCANPATMECCGGYVGGTCDRSHEVCCGGHGLCCDTRFQLCQICDDGHGVCSSNPPCPAGQVFDPTICNCKNCAQGLVWCGGHCILPCAENQVLNFNTCACSCGGAECGGQCCPVGKVCASTGGAGFPPKCCAADDICAGVCKSDSDVLCCGSGPSATACVAGRDSCCAKGTKGGPTCCRVENETCDQGRCVPKPSKKKKKKKKKH